MKSTSNAMHSEMPPVTLEDRRANIIIHMSNFKAYPSAQITIPTNAVTLINGRSGIGKTSIFEAIVFAFYDGVQNPEKLKTKRCYVWVFYGDYIVYRQKDPKLLKVWKIPLDASGQRQTQEYTNEEAQQVIDSIYGNLSIFLSCSYLRQKEFSVFLESSDADKLALVKTVALKGEELDEVKAPIKASVAALEQQFTGVKAQLAMAVKNLQDFDIQNPSIVKTQIPENPAEVVKKVQELRLQQEKHDKDFESAIYKESAMTYCKTQLDAVRDNKLKAEAGLPKINVEQVKARVEQIDNRLKEISTQSFDPEKLAKAQMFKLWSQEDQRLSNEIKSLEKELEGISLTIKSVFPDFVQASADAISFLEKKKTKVDEIKASNNEMKIILNQIGISSIQDGKTKVIPELEAEIAKAKETSDKIRSDLDKVRMANKMHCPECRSTLIVSEDGKHLEKCPDSAAPIPITKIPPPPSAGGLFGNVTTPASPKVESLIQTPSNVKTLTHDDLAKAVASMMSLMAKRDKLQSQISELELKTKDKISNAPSDIPDVDKAISHLSTIDKFINVQKNLDRLKDSRTRHQGTKPEEVSEKTVDTNSEKSSLESERSGLQKQLQAYDEMRRYIEFEETKIKDLTAMMANYVPQMGSMTSAEIRNAKMTVQGQIDQLLHLNTASELLAQRGILDKTMREKSEMAQRIERDHQAALRLYAKASEAERIILQSAVDEINVELSAILKRLFTTSPISVEISTTKALKSKKGAVAQRFDLKIFYNNAEYSSPKQLSGGEQDRLSLAITLAVNKRFGSPFLFLDETLSSLNPELKSEAVSLLKEFAPGRTVVVISHNETEGIFDRVMRLDQLLGPVY